MSTAQDRDMNHLAQMFRTPFERWLAAARAWCASRGLDILVYETARTAERQAWLYAQGRTRPGPVVTYTLDSSHEYNCAADWVPLRLVNGVWTQDWSHATYNLIYNAVPVEKFGLETFSWERPHVQIAGINGPKQNVSGSIWAAAHGIKVNTIVGSVWPLPAAPVVPALPPAPAAPDLRRRVFLVPLSGEGNVLMTETTVDYAGLKITRLPDGRVQIGPAVLTVFDDKALRLDRAKQ